MLLPLWVLIALVAQVFWVSGAIVDKYPIEKYFSGDDDEGVGALVLFFV